MKLEYEAVYSLMDLYEGGTIFFKNGWLSVDTPVELGSVIGTDYERGEIQVVTLMGPKTINIHDHAIYSPVIVSSLED